MYPAELQIKDTTESNTIAPYLDLFLSIGTVNFALTSMYNKRYDIYFLITNVPFLSSNILLPPVYGVLSHSSYATPGLSLLILRAVRLSNMHLRQGYFKEHLKSSIWKFYGRYGDIIKLY